MTFPPHGPPEITEAQQAATSLGEVEDPTPDNVSRALQDYSPHAVASAAASIGASGGGGGGGGLQLATITLNHDQILALPSTSVELLPSPGANSWLAVVAGFLSPLIVSGYVNIDSSAYMQVQSVPPGDQPLGYLTEDGSMITQLLTSSRVFSMTTAVATADGIFPQAMTGYDEGLELFMGNGSSGDLTIGDPANRLVVTLIYTTITVV